MNVKAFLLNLDKDTDRLAAADAQLKKLKIEYERVSAVYGKELTAVQWKRYVNHFHTLLAHGRIWSRGQVGCTLSHLFLYKRMVEEKIPIALVLEDDVQFSDDFHKGLVAAKEFVDVTKRQVILLSDHSDNIHQRLSETIDHADIVSIEHDICSEAYVITLPAAHELYRVNFPMVELVDAWGRYAHRGHIELFRTEPPVVKQNRTDFTTNIEMPTIKNNLVKHCAWLLWRCGGKLLDRIIFFVTGK